MAIYRCAQFGKLARVFQGRRGQVILNDGGWCRFKRTVAFPDIWISNLGSELLELLSPELS